jgi:hypothetical protein
MGTAGVARPSTATNPTSATLPANGRRGVIHKRLCAGFEVAAVCTCPVDHDIVSVSETLAAKHVDAAARQKAGQSRLLAGAILLWRRTLGGANFAAP